MILLAVALGLLLAALGLFVKLLVAVDPVRENLLIATGVALILAAFGGQGVFQRSAFIFAGVAAIALFLLSFLQWEGKSREAYVRGMVQNLPDDKFRAWLSFKDETLGALPRMRKRFDFIVFQEDAEGMLEGTLEIQKLQLNPDNNKEEFNNYATFSLKASCFADRIVDQTPLQWKFVDDTSEIPEYHLVDVSSGDVIAAYPNRGHEKYRCSSDSGEASNGILVGPALADEVAFLTPDELEKALANLSSDDTDIRRQARDSLAFASPSSFPRIMEFIRNDESYRARLGVSVGLAEMLRRDKALASQITLTDADAKLLLDLATQDDRTMRIYAGEFLYDLGSPLVTTLSLERAATLGADPAQDNARFNLIFVAQDGWEKMTQEQKAGLKDVLDKVKPTLENKAKTTEIFKRFEAQ